jgi:aspartate/methionine/tyrosine aminotransferase
MRLQDISEEVLNTKYAVRGPIVARAQELERQGREIIYCNIGNPQALQQRPLTWVRQVLALCEYPELLDVLPQGKIPSDAADTARRVIANSQHGLGAYTDSKGMRFVREAVARFIEERDQISADPEHIYLTDGASKGVQSVLRLLIAAPTDGILIPIPQYPLYSATITLLGGRQVPYFLDEGSGWKLKREVLEQSLQQARQQGTRVRAIAVINPGNPTGSVLDEKNIGMIVDFAREHGLAILADEVYQENIYLPGDRFVSFARVLQQRKIADVSLFSFHSCSKGLLGECGHRGGYFECRNVPAEVLDEITKLQSISLCANTVGQIVTYLMVHPPRPGDPSYQLYKQECTGIFNALRERAKILTDGLNKVPGIECQVVAGAMYAFPRVMLPVGKSDEDYCLALLEKTGVCIVPGTGFGQAPGTAHFRTTILPPLEKIEFVVQRIAEFHRSYR